MGILSYFTICSFLITSHAMYVYCVPDSDGNGTAWDDINGQTLIGLGRKLNRPLLTILGMALKKFHPCSEWTQWSQCAATRRGYFGTKSRQRRCEKYSSTNTMNTMEDHRSIDKDFGFCEGICPGNYNITEHGFCMKLYETEITQDSAEKQCQQDGGHLINIDSDVKHADVKRFVHGIKRNIFVDGRRKDVKSPWVFKYGSQKRHIKWASGQPDDATISLCLLLDEADTRLLHDIDCKTTRNFLCEISIM